MKIPSSRSSVKVIITYDFADRTETVDRTLIKNWFGYDEDGNVITEIKTEKNVQWYAFSSSKLKVGKSYTICIGDQETEVILESNYTEL